MLVKDCPREVIEALQHRGWQLTQEIHPNSAFDEYCQRHGLNGWGPQLRFVIAQLQP